MLKEIIHLLSADCPLALTTLYFLLFTVFSISSMVRFQECSLNQVQHFVVLHFLFTIILQKLSKNNLRENAVVKHLYFKMSEDIPYIPLTSISSQECVFMTGVQVIELCYCHLVLDKTLKYTNFCSVRFLNFKSTLSNKNVICLVFSKLLCNVTLLN